MSQRASTWATVAFLLVGMVLLPVACGRSGFQGISHGTLILERQDDLVLCPEPPTGVNANKVKLEVKGTPVESGHIKLVL